MGGWWGGERGHGGASQEGLSEEMAVESYGLPPPRLREPGRCLGVLKFCSPGARKTWIPAQPCPVPCVIWSKYTYLSESLYSYL